MGDVGIEPVCDLVKMGKKWKKIEKNGKTWVGGQCTFRYFKKAWVGGHGFCEKMVILELWSLEAKKLGLCKML